MGIISKAKLGASAKGLIGSSRAISDQDLQILESDQFIKSIPQNLMTICGDERLDVNSQRLLLPSSFGGTATLVVVDALTNRDWYQPGMTFKDHATAMLKDLAARFPSEELVLHTDTAAAEKLANAQNDDIVECGCAAIAKARMAIEMLLAHTLEIPEENRQEIIFKANELLDNGYFASNTARAVEELKPLCTKFEMLSGGHCGVIYIKNHRSNTVFDRPALYKACADSGQVVLHAFEYDVWSARKSAKMLLDDKQKVEKFVAAADAIMQATIRAIASPEMVVVDFE